MVVASLLVSFCLRPGERQPQARQHVAVALAEYERGDQPVAADDARDGQGAQRVDCAVALRRRGIIDAPGELPGLCQGGHRVTAAGSPSAMQAGVGAEAQSE
jgi:hypothetical protein